MNQKAFTIALASTLYAGLIATSLAGGQGIRCGTDTQLGIFEITDNTAANTYYVNDRGTAFGDGLWIYQESNGLWTPHGHAGVYHDTFAENLQRGGWSALLPTLQDNCRDEYEIPDTLIWGYDGTPGL